MARSAYRQPVTKAAILGSILLAASLAAGSARPAETATCAATLDAQTAAAWSRAGGAAGSLGCPVEAAGSAITARSGTIARQTRFAGGAILRHVDGPWAGRGFVVAGCAWRLYFQYGGAAGWLGLPTGEAVNTPDGKRQSFEGGFIRADRDGACEAEPSAPAAIAVAGPTSPIDLFHDSVSGDDAVAGTEAAAKRLTGQGYRRVETLGYGLTAAGDGVTPLRQFAAPAGDAHLAAATAEGEAEARAEGFVFEGAQGFVLAEPGAGRLPLKAYWNPLTHRGLLATSPADEADARARGYVFARIEGFVLATPRP